MDDSPLSIARIVYEDFWSRRFDFAHPDRRGDQGQPVPLFADGCTPAQFEKWLFGMLLPDHQRAADDNEPVLMIDGGGI